MVGWTSKQNDKRYQEDARGMILDYENSYPIDPTHGWPIAGYRCNGCTKARFKSMCAYGQCPVFVNIEKLNPTLTTREVAEILGVSRVTVNDELKYVDGVYMAGCWQIPKDALNRPPLSEIQAGRRRKL